MGVVLTLSETLVAPVAPGIAFENTIQSDRETWLVDVAATPHTAGAGATARIDGGILYHRAMVSLPPTAASVWLRRRRHIDLCRTAGTSCRT